MTRFILCCLLLAASAGVQAQQWKTYSDSKIGVELKYPPDWTHRRLGYFPESGIFVEIFEAPGQHDGQGDFWVQINPTNPKNLTIERWFEEFKRPQHKDPLKPQIGKVSKGTVDGQPALLVNLQGTAKGLKPSLMRYVARPGGRVFAITEMCRQAPDKPSPIAEKMAASVKFLKN
jgi:hypothetical protein